MERVDIPEADPKLVSILSYLTFIGWLVAYFVFYPKNKSALGAFHLRQTLLLYIVGLGASILGRGYMWPNIFISGVLGIAMFVLWIVGFVGALKGEYKQMPVIGDWAQQWFRNI